MVMRSPTRKILSVDAPLIIQELRTAFDLHEAQLKEQALRQRAAVQDHVPGEVLVPFQLDRLQVYAVYHVHTGRFSRLMAYAQDEKADERPSFVLTVFL